MKPARRTLASPRPLSRRKFLADVGGGFTGLVLATMLYEDGIARAAVRPTDAAALVPRAKSVIWLFMLGGVSHLETFDPKPALNKYAGKTIDASPFKKAVLESPYYRKNVKDFAGTPRALMNKLYPLQVGCKKRGRSGIEMSDWWPHLATRADDLAVVRSMWTTDNDHAAQLQFHTGRHAIEGVFPTIGSFLHGGYLGTAAAAMPTFTNPNNVSIVTGTPPSVHGIAGNYYLDRETGREIMMTDERLMRSETILALMAAAGVKTAAITAKDKLRRLLGRNLDGVCFSSECAAPEMEAMVGRARPDMYSADLSLFVLDAGIALLKQQAVEQIGRAHV